MGKGQLRTHIHLVNNIRSCYFRLSNVHNCGFQFERIIAQLVDVYEANTGEDNIPWDRVLAVDVRGKLAACWAQKQGDKIKSQFLYFFSFALISFEVPSIF